MVGILVTNNDISQSRMQNILTIVQAIKANPTVQGTWWELLISILTSDTNHNPDFNRNT